jgi:hypothetical protein
MTTIFDPQVYDSVISRIGKLQPASERQWGKMTCSQMLEHTARAAEMALGLRGGKQRLIGRILSPFFRKMFLGEAPFPKNSPTGPDFVITGDPDFEAARKRLVDLVGHLHRSGPEKLDGHVHGFFGPLTGDEWGRTQFKHIDHHLRQFGV